ncbi:MAG: S-ribosylhomocysteine lyase [Oscillospiraceae bacterium]
MKDTTLNPQENTNDGLIPSFSVDHDRIIPGIFLSREDTVGNGMVTTYDIRVTIPNQEPAIDVAAMHSLEHIIATFLRNDPDWKDEVVYWGPMGCLTGFYLILKGSRSPQEIYGLVLRAFQAVEGAENVPGASAANCGNYLMHNLGMAKWYATKFAKYLASNAENPAIFEYPKTERLITEDGQHFYDS